MAAAAPPGCARRDESTQTPFLDWLAAYPRACAIILGLKRHAFEFRIRFRKREPARRNHSLHVPPLLHAHRAQDQSLGRAARRGGERVRVDQGRFLCEPGQLRRGGDEGVAVERVLPGEVNGAVQLEHGVAARGLGAGRRLRSRFPPRPRRARRGRGPMRVGRSNGGCRRGRRSSATPRASFRGRNAKWRSNFEREYSAQRRRGSACRGLHGDRGGSSRR